MADTPYRRHLQSLNLRTGPAAPKVTVDHHDRGAKVVVTERTDRDGDHQDVTVMPAPINVKLGLNQERS